MESYLLPLKPPSRAGLKLAHTLNLFNLSLENKVCADFGANSGGFTAVMLNAGAKKVYAVETGYGVLDWLLRNDVRVINLERVNALHVKLPEKVDLISIDTSWTKQKNILPNAILNLKPDGIIVTLVKPHYESSLEHVHKGKLLPEYINLILTAVEQDILSLGLKILGKTKSPIVGKSKGNEEFVYVLAFSAQADHNPTF